MPKSHYDSHQLDDLVLQMMETELGGEQVYRTALTCAIHPDLKKEWEGYLEETLAHQNVVRGICDALGLDPDAQSPTRAVVKHIGTSLVQAMQLAKKSGTPEAAQLVACECVVHAETKDHANWELLGQVAKVATGDVGHTLKVAHKAVEKVRKDKAESTALAWLQRFGPRACFLSFLPAVGDPLCAVAGWLKMPFWPCVGWMAIGKFLRYVVLTALLLWVLPPEWVTRLVQAG